MTRLCSVLLWCTQYQDRVLLVKLAPLSGQLLISQPPFHRRTIVTLDLDLSQPQSYSYNPVEKQLLKRDWVRVIEVETSSAKGRQLTIDFVPSGFPQFV